MRNLDISSRKNRKGGGIADMLLKLGPIIAPYLSDLANKSAKEITTFLSRKFGNLLGNKGSGFKLAGSGSGRFLEQTSLNQKKNLTKHQTKFIQQNPLNR